MGLKNGWLELNRAFSACLGSDQIPRAMPQALDETAPTALKRLADSEFRLRAPEAHGANQSPPLMPAQAKNAEQSSRDRRGLGNDRAIYLDVIYYVLQVEAV